MLLLYGDGLSESGYSGVVGKDCILVISIAAHPTLVLDSSRFVRPYIYIYTYIYIYIYILRLTSACGHRE